MAGGAAAPGGDWSIGRDLVPPAHRCSTAWVACRVDAVSQAAGRADGGLGCGAAAEAGDRVRVLGMAPETWPARHVREARLHVEVTWCRLRIDARRFRFKVLAVSISQRAERRPDPSGRLDIIFGCGDPEIHIEVEVTSRSTTDEERELLRRLATVRDWARSPA